MNEEPGNNGGFESASESLAELDRVIDEIRRKRSRQEESEWHFNCEVADALNDAAVVIMRADGISALDRKKALERILEEMPEEATYRSKHILLTISIVWGFDLKRYGLYVEENE